MNLKSIVKICLLILIISSCQDKNKISGCDYYVLGAFYANNQKDLKDSTNHFQQNCHFLFLLQSDTIEVYNRNSGYPDTEETTTKFKMSEVESKRFISIVSKLSSLKKIHNDNNILYDGLSYIAVENTCHNTNYFIAKFGIEKDDEDFILKIFEKSKHKKTTNSSNRLIKEKYFMTALLHQENYIKEVNVKFKD